MFVSGEEVAGKLEVSRAAVSKACAALRKEGFDIESRTNHGYMLAASEDMLSEDTIKEAVTVDSDIEVFDTVTSTNDLAKTAELGPGAAPKVFIADKQTNGRGRLGRKFESPSGTGLYMSIAMRPEFDIKGSLFVTMAAAVGVARAIRKVTGAEAGIKWVNDLFIGGKKVCGILTEAASDLESGEITRLVIGIGVNCFPGSFPPEVSKIAGAIDQKRGAFSRSLLAAEIVNETLPIVLAPDTAEFLKEYRRLCILLGKDIKVHRDYSDAGEAATALEITDDGGLLVKYHSGEKAGMEEVLHTGEVSISI